MLYENLVLNLHLCLLTLIVFRDVTLLQENIMTSYLFTLLSILSSILSSILIDERIDKLVIYFHTNEQDGEQNNYMVNFSNKSDLR